MNLPILWARWALKGHHQVGGHSASHNSLDAREEAATDFGTGVSNPSQKEPMAAQLLKTLFINPSSVSLLPSFWPWFLLPALQEHKPMALVKGHRRKRLLLLVRKVDDQTWLLPSKDRNSSSSVTPTGRGERGHPVGKSVLLAMERAKSYKVKFVKS